MHTTHFHPKNYTHHAERAAIAYRQMRDGLHVTAATLATRTYTPRLMTVRRTQYFAARSYVRYAQEARLVGDVDRAARLVGLARAVREVARARLGHAGENQ